MKPFNLEKALAGSPVVTKNGLEVKDLTLMSAAKEAGETYVLAGYVPSCGINTWIEDGTHDVYGDGENGFNLFMGQEKKQLWKNIYRRNTEGSFSFVYVGAVNFLSKEEALTNRDENTGRDTYLDTVLVYEWEE